MWSPGFSSLGIDNNVIVVFRKMACRILRRIDLLPKDGRDEIIATENLIHHETKRADFVVVQANEDRSILAQELLQQHEPGIHHAEPFVVSGEVLSLLADGFAEPAEDFRGVDVVVIDPALVAGVVGRIDADALHFPRIARQQRFERMEVVALHDQVARGGITMGKLLVRFEQAERYLLVVPHHRVLPDPVQRGHGNARFGVCSRSQRIHSKEERDGIAGRRATDWVRRAEGCITVRPSGGRGVRKSH